MADMSISSDEASDAVDEDSSSDSETNEALGSLNVSKAREERMHDYQKNCQHLITFLKTYKYPPSLPKRDRRNIRNQARTHVWDEKDENLYYTGGKKDIRKLVLTDIRDIDKVISERHVKHDGTHLGINNTLAAVSSKYLWMGMKMDIAKHVSSCERCRLKNRLGVDKIKGKDPLSLVRVDMDGGEEFSFETTVMLIEAVKKRQRNLTSRQNRVTVYKEVQEELAQRGHFYSATRLRRKWNSLVEMHKRMKREIYQNNPPWQFYTMIEDVVKEPDSTKPHEGPYPTQEEESNYPHSDNSYQNHHATSYHGNPYIHPHENMYSSQQNNNYPIQQGHSFSAQPTQHTNSNPMHVSSSQIFFKCDPNQLQVPPGQGHNLRPPPEPSAAPAAVGPSATCQQSSGSYLKFPSSIRREFQRLGTQQQIVYSQLKDVDFTGPKSQGNCTKKRDRMDRLKLKYLKKISKELQAISSAQSQILSKQDRLLNAVLGQM